MITTGNLYIQVYDSLQNKYVELPSNELSIATYIRSGFFPLTGFLITGDLRLNKKLEMASIDLGRYNKTYQGHNIGVGNNIIGLTGSVWQTYPSFNIGSLNYQTSGYNSFNIGQSNSIASNDTSFAIGTSNSISALNSLYNSNEYVLGNDNQLSLSGDNNYVIGQLNDLNFVIFSSKILGDDNTINSGQYVKIIGNGNLLQNSSYIDSFGDANIFDQSDSIISIGDANDISSSTGIFNISKSSQILTSQNVLVFGNSNLSQDGNNSLIIGQSNTLSGSEESIVIGFFNDIANTGDFRSTIIGYDNNFSDQVSNIDVFGDYNSNSGYFYDSFIIGSNNYGVNTADSNINGFVNIVQNSDYINIFGANNEVDRSFSNSIFGRYNTLSSGTNCNIIGDNNSVSGLQNYVFGNNNIVRSGDYNSILIGISHEFSGDFKVASINIASIDTNIEVNPTTIKLTSTNRPTINDENIIITSDLNSYLTKNNGLSNSGIFTGGFIFQDQSYSNLPSRIYLDSFSYTGRSGINYDIQFTGYFASANIDGVPASIFTLSNFNIFGTTSYSGKNISLIFGNHTIPQFDPTWLIVDNKSSGIYYRNDLYPMNEIPQTGWVVTGFRGYSGKNPVYPNLILSGNKGASISINPRNTGLISSYDPTYGKIYIPFFY